MADKEKLTIVLLSGDLDRALAAFIVATTAASMNMDVTMYFTFWGLNIIKRNDAPIGGKSLIEKMLNFINRGGAKRAKLSKLNMLGLGTYMMKGQMKKAGMPSLDEFIQIAHGLGVKMMPCSTTCGVMGGLNEEVFRPEVSSLAGAAFFVNEARQSKVTLFI